jgi:polar amino acid transport system substrate-binding protein
VSKLVEGGKDVEQVKPFTDPIVNGKPVRNYGGFAFRPEDKDLHAAFSKALVEFRATDDYKKILVSYGLSAESIKAAAGKNVADLCAGK